MNTDIKRKDYSQTKKEVIKSRYYKLTDIARAGWIYNDAETVKGVYEFIFKLVKRNKIKSKNVSLGKKPFYKIRGVDILNYSKNNF